MIDIVLQVFRNWAQIWMSNPAGAFWQGWMAYAIGTFFLCLPIYMLTAGPTWLFGVKSRILTKVFNYTLIGNAMLALAPCVIPIAVPAGMSWAAYRLLRPQRRQQPKRREQGRRSRRRHDDYDDGDDYEE